MIEQDWAHGFVGGLMIGGAAALYLLVNGRIMGASGILGSLLEGSDAPQRAEKLAFVAALVLVPLLIVPFYSTVDTHLTDNWLLIGIGGLLTGLGTRLANGCTSGHGVCGISRLAPRGIVATVFYILAGGIVMVLFRHVLGVI